MPVSAVRDLAHLRELVGGEVAVSDWMEITQERIHEFADLTGDHNWIHVDVERARHESPFHATVAHGFLTLSLLSQLAGVVRVPGVRVTLNYGLDRVRFITPVPAGSRIRARLTLQSLKDETDGGIRALWSVIVEREGADKPCCAAEWLLMYYPN